MEVPESDLEIDPEYESPRCDRPTVGSFYGPCPDCVAALGQAYPGLARDVAAPEYEPKMNVTPNAVATKE